MLRALAARVAILLITLAGLACGGPSDDDVGVAFLAEHPGYTVLEVASGEGDGDHVYKHVRFRRGGRTEVCEVVWLYQRTDPEWRVVHRSDAVIKAMSAAQAMTPCPE